MWETGPAAPQRHVQQDAGVPPSAHRRSVLARCPLPLPCALCDGGVPGGGEAPSCLWPRCRRAGSRGGGKQADRPGSCRRQKRGLWPRARVRVRVVGGCPDGQGLAKKNPKPGQGLQGPKRSPDHAGAMSGSQGVPLHVASCSGRNQNALFNREPGTMFFGHGPCFLGFRPCLAQAAR